MVNITLQKKGTLINHLDSWNKWNNFTKCVSGTILFKNKDSVCKMARQSVNDGQFLNSWGSITILI